MAFSTSQSTNFPNEYGHTASSISDDSQDDDNVDDGRQCKLISNTRSYHDDIQTRRKREISALNYYNNNENSNSEFGTTGSSSEDHETSSETENENDSGTSNDNEENITDEYSNSDSLTSEDSVSDMEAAYGGDEEIDDDTNSPFNRTKKNKNDSKYSTISYNKYDIMIIEDIPIDKAGYLTPHMEMAFREYLQTPHGKATLRVRLKNLHLI